MGITQLEELLLGEREWGEKGCGRLSAMSVLLKKKRESDVNNS